MPTTYNGIGTHYCGKKNPQSRSGVCRYCGSQVQLESYDTRLWFVVLMIPIVPLGRKRILDYCPRCTRHQAAELSQWEMSKQLSVSGALEQYRNQPTPETAAEFHGHLIAFHMVGEADAFRQEALAQYPDSAPLHAGLALQLEQVGKYAEAAELFEKAIILRPDLPEARIGVARARINQGQLDEARELLRFLEEPGAGQLYSLAPLDVLAHVYQQKSRHEETLQLCQCLLREYPHVGEIHDFRTFVRTSEKALRRSESLLPARRFSLRGLFDTKSGQYASWQRWAAVAAVVAVLFVVGMAVMNEHRRRHRSVVALNDCGQPAQVTIDDQAPIQVASMEKLELGEGRHHVKIAGPVTEEFDVEMHSGYWQRWSNSPVWVINVGGAAALADETLYYAVNPRPVESQYVVGKNFSYFPHVDYLFEKAPDSMDVGSEKAEVVKTRLGRAEDPPAEILSSAVAQADPKPAFQFAEVHLRRDPEDNPLLRAYIGAAMAKGQSARAQEFLEAGLWRTPISIPWHRAYQDLVGEDKAEALAPRYDAELAKQPNDARLLYLRGRVSLKPAEEREYFRRSAEADPTLGWPWCGLAFDAGSRGDWKNCLLWSEKAHAATIEEPSFSHLRDTARLAAGDAAALEGECRDGMNSGNLEESGPAALQLCDLLAAQGKPEEAKQAMALWANRFQAQQWSAAMARLCRQIAAYMVGDFAALEADLTEPGALGNPEFQLHLLAATGKAQEIVDDPSLKELRENPWNAIVVSLAFSLSGQEKEAAEWRERACQGMEGKDHTSRQIVALLRSAEPPSQEQLDDVLVTPSNKALLLAALAVRFPERKAEFAAAARQLNVSRRPPYHLVQKVTEMGQ